MLTPRRRPWRSTGCARVRSRPSPPFAGMSLRLIVAVTVRTYEVIEHTADVGILARGDTVEEVFTAAAEWMLSFIVRPEDVHSLETRRRVVEADDRGGLLVAWLNDLLLVLNADAFVPGEVAVLECGETRLVADVRGEAVDPARHRFRLDVKAATYHQLEVARENGWRARVILDV